MQSTNDSLRWLAWVMAAALWSGAATAHAALITFSFNGAAGNEASFAPDAQPVGIAASSLTRGSGVNPSASAGRFSASGWTTAGVRDLADYYALMITPEAGHELALTRLELDERRSATGIRQWAIYSSLDDYASALASFAVPDNDSIRAGQGVDLGAPFAALTGQVEFRIYGFAAEGAAGTWWIDNVKLSGSVERRPVAVPDAGSSLALLGGGLAVVGWAARRRR